MEKTKVIIEMPIVLKTASEEEAKRRMTSLSGLIRDELKKFLPENIDKPIK